MTNKNDSKTSTDLKLLDLTLKNAGAIQFSCMGDFTAPSSQEIIVGRPGGAIEIYRIETSSSTSNSDEDDEDEEEEQRTWLKLILRTETRSTLRSIETVRLSGEKRDLVLIGSDSGCVSVLDFEGGQKAKILHCPILGKTGTKFIMTYIIEYMFYFYGKILIIHSCSQNTIFTINITLQCNIYIVLLFFRM